MKQTLLIVLGLSIIANIIGFTYISLNAHPPDGYQSGSADQYPLLSPRIFAEKQNDILVNFVKLRADIAAYISATNLNTDSKKSPSFGMYFEYLPSGISIGVGEKNSYIAASLLKVPIIMGVYKYIASGHIHEDDVLTIKDEFLDPSYGDLWKKGAGSTISVADAIKLTLIKSDNTAKSVLYGNTPPETLTDVYQYLDIPFELNGNVPVVSPKNYSSILRSLYLSSYLTPEYSNKLLTLLTQSDFNDKLSAGIPDAVKVAHKIGVQDVNNPNGSIYTDCGIVYVPKRPYILCLMMRDTETNAQTHMKSISKIIYDYVTKTNTPSSN